MIRQAQSFVGKLKNILWNQYNRSGIVCYNGLPQNSALRLEKPRSYSTTSANNTTSDTEAKDGQGKKYPETPSESASQKNTTADSNSTTTTETQQAKDEQQQRQQQQKANISLEPEDLVQQIQEQEQQISQLKELSLRAYAEMENVRKIAQRDVDNAKKYSIGAFAKDLLDVADNLERALQNIPKEKLDPDKGDTVVISLYEGVKATVSNDWYSYWLGST